MKHLKIKFEPRDTWIGLYRNKVRIDTLETKTEWTDWYLCIIPCFPICWQTKKDLMDNF